MISSKILLFAKCQERQGAVPSPYVPTVLSPPTMGIHELLEFLRQLLCPT